MLRHEIGEVGSELILSSLATHILGMCSCPPRDVRIFDTEMSCDFDLKAAELVC